MANGRLWTNEEIEILENCYKKQMSMAEMTKLFPNRTSYSISVKAEKMGFTSIYIKKNNVKYKAIYQNKDWLINEVLQGKTYKEIAKDAGASERVIQKWQNEVYHLSFRRLYKLTPLQRQIVIWGTLGDGHIDKRDTQPLYVESHAINEKDYLFWKYEQLKPMFNNEPTFYGEKVKKFGDMEYNCQASYRMSSKIIDDLKSIREMSKIEKINTLDKLGLCLYLLDDGSRNDSNWQLCFATFNNEEKNLFINLCQERLGLNGWVQKDERYMVFDSPSSRRIDDLMLSIFSEDMDIIQKKIIKHRKVRNDG